MAPTLSTDRILNLKFKLTTAKIKLWLMADILYLICFNNDKMENNLAFSFQKMASRYQDANADKDSLSLLAEQETPMMSQDEDASMMKNKKEEGPWKCPKCKLSYKHEKSLINHLEKKHSLNETLDESGFNPSCASSQDGSRAAKRRREGEEGGSSSDAGRDRMSTISEGSVDLNVDEGLLDHTLEEDRDTFGQPTPKATQEIASSIAQTMAKAEKDLVNLDMNASGSDPDESIRRDEEKEKKNLENNLQIKDNLLHIRQAEIHEKEGKISELEEIVDLKERRIQAAQKKLKEKDEEVKKLKEAIRKMDDPDEPSKEDLLIEKEGLKKDLIRAEENIKNINGKMINQAKELKTAKANLRKHEVDHVSFEKVKTSLDVTLLQIQEIERKCDELESENAKLRKKIPCQKEKCDLDKRCPNSHSLRYEDRSAPRNNQWRKTLLCRFFNQPQGCN